MRIILIITILTSLANILRGQDFKILKPNLDDSCEVINEIHDDEFEQIIYIDKKVNSIAKDRISNFNLSEWSLDQIKTGHSEVKTNKDIVYNTKHQSLPDKWIRIGRYNDKWILYNNPAFNIRYILTDSTFIRFVKDGVVFYTNVNYRYENNWHLFD